MSMSRKDFERLAYDIKWQLFDTDSEDLPAMERFVRKAVLPTLQASNPAFDTQRFLTACGF